MTDDDRGYVEDLIRTAEDHVSRAHALLTDAQRIIGGETRDAIAHRPQPTPSTAPLP